MKSFPEDWDIIELKDVNIEIIDGDRGVNYPKQSEFLPEGHCLFLNTGNIKEDKFVFPANTFVSEERDNLLRKGKLKRKDIVLTTRGTVGSVAYYKSTIPYEHIRINSGMVIMRCGDGLDTNFIYQVLKSPFIKEQYRMFSSGSAQPQLPIKDLRRIPLVLPPFPIQQKIAAILSAYDDLIENNNKRIALLEKAADEVYREWFVRMRFPGWEQVNFVKGVPEEWDIVQISDLYKTTSGGTPSRTQSKYYDGDIPWVKTGELLNGFVIDTEEKITEFGLENSSAKLFPMHTVMMAMYGVNIGQLGILSIEAASNQACCAFFSKFLYLEYHYTFLLLKSLKDHLISISFGGAQQNVSQDVIKKCKVLKPKSELIGLFCQYTAGIYFEMEALLKTQKHLKQSRDLLLSRLISGKLPVEGLDIRFPPSMMREAVTVPA